MNNEKKLTTAFGAPVPDNRNSATAGKRGPVLMQDVWLMEKLAHFEREVIPERRMHAKGSGAFGTFSVTNDIPKNTKAKFMLIIKNTDFIYNLYNVKGLYIKSFDKKYLVSIKNRNDTNVEHLIITNYEI